MRTQPLKTPRKTPKSQYIAIDTKTTGRSFWEADRPYYVSTCDDQGSIQSWEFEVSPQRKVIVPADFPDKFWEVVGNRVPIFHNAKFDIQALRSIGVDVCPDDPKNQVNPPWFHDTLIASHLFRNLYSHKLKDLARELLNFPITDEKNLINVIKQARILVRNKPHWLIAKPDKVVASGDGGNWLKVDSWLPHAVLRHRLTTNVEWSQTLSTYGDGDAERTIGLWLFFKAWMDSPPQKYLDAGVDLWAQYHEAMQVVPCVLDMETRGVTLNWKNLQQEKVHYQGAITKAEEVLLNGLDESFNLNSHTQLRRLIYEDWGFPVMGHTDSGLPSTDSDNLSKLILWGELFQVVDEECPRDPITRKKVKADMESHLNFLRSLQERATARTALTYLEGYESSVDSAFLDDSGLSGPMIPTVRPSYNQIGTATVRFSSSDPNITNVGKGTEEDGLDGEKVKNFELRKCFGPTPGRIWFAIDYQQLQLVIFAHMANDEGMLAAFGRGDDFHNYVASQLFNTKEPTKLQRRIAKNVNFALTFGGGEAKVDATAGHPGAYQLFKGQFPLVGRYMAETVSKIRRTGICATMGGYPMMVERNRAYAGVNYIDQGTEGQLVKRAMVNCRQHLLGSPNYLAFMVHDELVFDFKVHNQKRKAPSKDKALPYPFAQYQKEVLRLKQIMEEAALSVGVKARASVSVIIDNWADAQELDW